VVILLLYSVAFIDQQIHKHISTTGGHPLTILSLGVFFFGDFSPLGTPKKKPVQLLQWIFRGELAQSHQILRGKKNLKLSYLDKKFQHVAKIYQDFYSFSTFLSDL
jgi:hypothetical protein